MESRTTRFKKFAEQMRERAKQERKNEEGNKRVCAGDKPFTGMKKEKEGNEK